MSSATETKETKKPRATPAEVVESFTREDILATISEANEIGEKIARAQRRAARQTEIVKLLQETKADEKEIAEALEDLADFLQEKQGVELRLTYLESKIRRCAVAMMKAKGRNFLCEYITKNIEEIPTVEDKTKRAAFVQDATEIAQ